MVWVDYDGNDILSTNCHLSHSLARLLQLLSMYLSLAFKLSASEFPDQFVHLLRVRYSVHLIQHQDGRNSRVSDQEVEYPFRNGLADEPIRHVMYHTD